MTTPTLVPTKYSGDAKPWLRAKVDKNGCVRLDQFSVSVASGTASDTVVGLIPFQKGARFLYSSTIYVPDMDSNTDLTLDFGYVYNDNVTYTNDPNAFANQVTTGQAGGFITFGANEGVNWEAAAEGWIVMVVGVGGTASAAAAEVKGQIEVAYDG